MPIYITLISFVVTLIATPLLTLFAKRYKILDPFEGDELKIHKSPTPCLGGLAMLLGILMSLIFLILLEKDYLVETLGTMSGIIIIFTFGFWDDWKWKHVKNRRPQLKTFLIIVLCLIVAAILTSVGIIPDFFISFLPPILVSFGAIFIVANTINLEDGMDVLAGLLTLISAIGFALVFLSQGMALPLVISISLIGAVLAFLRFNFPPASIFMGDSGAYTLGSILAILILFLPQLRTLSGFIASIFLIGVPVFESFYSLSRRVLSGSSFFLGDRGHAFDRMLKAGYSSRKTLFVFGIIQLFSVILGVFLILWLV